MNGRVLFCAIASKRIKATLRPGGGLGEPTDMYVRCDERDCQYADQNRPPCPLSTALFDDGSERRLGAHLQAHAGSRICYACLTEALGMTHDQVRRASWRLKEQPGVSIRPARCRVCTRRGVTIGLIANGHIAIENTPSVTPAPIALPEVADLLDAYLRRHRGLGFCAQCLVSELSSKASVVRDAMWALESGPTFWIRQARCELCGVKRAVIRFDEQPTDQHPGRVPQVLSASPGVPLCAACIALSADLALADVRRIVHELRQVPELEQLEAACSACGRWQTVVRARTGSIAEAGRLEAIAEELCGVSITAASGST